MLQVERFFRQCRMLLWHCCRFWQQCYRFRQQCRMKFRPFDNVETNRTCSVCFDLVERTKFHNRIVRHCCRLWQQSRMLLRQCCLLLRHCCWCGRSFTLDKRGMPSELWLTRNCSAISNNLVLLLRSHRHHKKTHNAVKISCLETLLKKVCTKHSSSFINTAISIEYGVPVKKQWFKCDWKWLPGSIFSWINAYVLLRLKKM